MLLASLFLFVGMALAQTEVSGTVISHDDGQPVIGATIMLKGTKTGTVTDIDGKFSLTSTQSNPTIIVTYVGMKDVTMKGKKNMKIVLESNAQEIGEVVVTGMQKMDKRLFTGATTKIDANKANLTVWLISAARSKAVQPVYLCRTYPERSVPRQRSACVVLPLFTVRLNHCGWLTVSSWRT